MRRLLAIILLLFSGLVLMMAMNQSFINRIKQDRYFDHLKPAANKSSLYHRLFIRSDRWRYGDIYGLCYLPQFKLPLQPFKEYNQPLNYTPTGRVLYIIGDSFLADKAMSEAFSGFDQVIFTDRRFPLTPIKPDTTKQNYVLMEFAERNLVSYNAHTTGEIPQSSSTGMIAGAEQPKSLFDRLGNILFNKDLDRNIEQILFDDRIFTPVKEAKAALNYQLFNRVVKEAAVSTAKDRLFLNMTVDTGYAESAFKDRPDNFVDSVVRHLNEAGKYYRSAGFKNVYLGVIPNSVSVYDEKRMPYNRLLERVEQKTNLTVISVYKDFKSDKRNLFYRSDAHWNPAGFDLWITETNKVLQAGK